MHAQTELEENSMSHGYQDHIPLSVFRSAPRRASGSRSSIMMSPWEYLQTGWHFGEIFSLSVSHQASDARIGAPHAQLFDEGTSRRSQNPTVSHLQRYSTLDDIQRRVDPTVALYGYDIPRGGVGSRPPPRSSQFVARRERPPGGHVDERRSGTSDWMQSNDESSKLTKEEQEKVLKMLRKEWYNPNPTVRMITNNVGLYYRDRAENANYRTPMGKGVDEEDSKRCAICLDDFEVKSQVTVTPCNHMFHEDCIVPWLKSQGQCPVCRFAFCNPVR